MSVLVNRVVGLCVAALLFSSSAVAELKPLTADDAKVLNNPDNYFSATDDNRKTPLINNASAAKAPAVDLTAIPNQANSLERLRAIPQKDVPQRLQALIELHSVDELRSLLTRAEQIVEGNGELLTEDPIALVLHGAEIEIFKRSNYRDNKQLVDLAARLDAFNVVDLKVCQRWVGAHNLTLDDLPPFLEPVPYGAAEIQKLEDSGYAYF